MHPPTKFIRLPVAYFYYRWMKNPNRCLEKRRLAEFYEQIFFTPWSDVLPRVGCLPWASKATNGGISFRRCPIKDFVLHSLAHSVSNFIFNHLPRMSRSSAL